MNKSLSSSRAACSKMLYDIDDNPPVRLKIPLAIQHVCGMFGATILVPILVNQACGANVLSTAVAICMSGVGTIVYQICTKGRSPVYLGSSFAFIAAISAAYLSHGLGGAMTGLIAVGLIYVVAAILVGLVGTAWLDFILPPVVRGPMIMVIGFGLAPSAVSQMGIDGSGPIDLKSLAVAIITLGAAIFFMTSRICKRALSGFLSIIPFLAAIVIGYIAALLFGLVDFTPVIEAPWFALPDFKIIGIHWHLDFGAIWTVAPLTLATLSEHIGDHKVISTITGRDLLKNPGLLWTLLGDGLATLLAALFGAPANTSYGENGAIMGITKIASRRVVTLAAIFAILISCIGKLIALIATIPSPVLGGVSLLLYGFIGLNGMKDIQQSNVNYDYSRNIAISAIMLALGLGGAVISFALGNTAISFSGMSLAAIVGVLLNLFIPKSIEEKQEEEQQKYEKDLLTVVKANAEILSMAEATMQKEAK